MAIVRACRAVFAAIASVIGPDEVLLATALVLLSMGCWLVWQPAAFLVPGVVLLWIALPSRVSFVVRHQPTGRLQDMPPPRKRVA